MHTFHNHVPLTLQMTSTEATTDFSDFQALQRAYFSLPNYGGTYKVDVRFLDVLLTIVELLPPPMTINEFIRYINPISWEWESRDSTLVCKFVRPDTAILDDIQMKMNGLLELICTSDIHFVTTGDQTKFVTRVSQEIEEVDTLEGGESDVKDHDDILNEHVDGDASREYEDTLDSSTKTFDKVTCMTFAELKTNVFLHLTDILLQVLDSCDEFPHMPEPWMDGTGKMIHKVDSDTPKKFHATHASGWTDTVGDDEFIAVVDSHLYRFGSLGSRHTGCHHDPRVCAYCHWVILLRHRWMRARWGNWRVALRDYKRWVRADE
jgi:hypothetical protein